MLKALLATALLVTPMGLLVIIFGDPHLLSTGNYRLAALLWTVHLLFWIGYMVVIAPPFLAVFRGGRRLPGDEFLASLCVGVVGFLFAFGACVYYLHKDLGFFSPTRLPINLAVFAALLGVAAVMFRTLRARGEAFQRVWWIAPGVGVLIAAGIWGTMFAKSIPNDAELNIESLALTPAADSANGPVRDASGRIGRRVVILGLDGADWQQIDPLIAAGKLPNFARVKAEGAWAPMQTVSPFSPVVWTSIATGMDPGRHSVQYFSEMYSPELDVTVQRLNYNFLEPLLSRILKKIPVSSTTRTSKAIWEILGAFGRESLVINWWASFPAEPGKSTIISNYAMPWDDISAARIEQLGPAAQRVFPESIWPQVLRVMKTAVGEQSTSSGEGIVLEKKITNAAFWDARDRAVVSLYREFDRRDLSLAALYLQGVDTTSHHYSESVFGENMDQPRGPRVSEDVIAQKRAMLDHVYERMDALAGELIAGQEEGDLLVIVSDHGWRYDGTSHWRFPDGIFAAYGSAVKRGFSPGRIHVYDVTPTLLHFYGLPVSSEMPGKIVDSVFTPEANGLLPRVTIASYGPRVRPLRLNDPAMDAEYKSKLKSLGYVQ